MNGVPLWEIGGPHIFASSQSAFTVPISTVVPYDYKLYIRNSDGPTTISGGLNGEPSRVNIYYRGPYESVALYFAFQTLYVQAHVNSPAVCGWSKNSSDRTIVYSTFSVTSTYGIDWRSRDSERVAPNQFCTAIPPAATLAYVGTRVFAGNVYDTVTSERKRGDLYYSGKGNLRMQAVYTDEYNGGRNQYAGEEIKRIMSMSAGSQSAVYILVWTDRELKVLGGSGPLGGASAGASDLGTTFTLSQRGTNSPRTIVSAEGMAFWLDQYGQHQRLKDGVVQNISRTHVDDKPKTIPASMRASAYGFYWKDTYCFAYAGASGTSNGYVMGFNTVIDRWEFNDALPGVVSAERAITWYDSTKVGSGQRLIFGASNGSLYEYDIDGVGDLGTGVLDVSLTTQEYTAPADRSVRMGGIWMTVTAQNTSWTFRRYYREQTGVTRSEANSRAGRFYDGARTEVESGFEDGRGERGKAVYLTVSGSVLPGSVLGHLGCELLMEARDDAEVGEGEG